MSRIQGVCRRETVRAWKRRVRPCAWNFAEKRGRFAANVPLEVCGLPSSWYSAYVAGLPGNRLAAWGGISLSRRQGEKWKIPAENIVSGADIVVFITTVNSHGALDVVKAVCKKNGKKFIARRKRTGISQSVVEGLLCINHVR